MQSEIMKWKELWNDGGCPWIGFRRDSEEAFRNGWEKYALNKFRTGHRMNESKMNEWNRDHFFFYFERGYFLFEKQFVIDCYFEIEVQFRLK